MNPSRTFALTREINLDARTVDMACSSEEPYDRWWGTEILDHSPGAIDLSRLADGRHPFLLNHCMNDQIGVIESVTLGADRVLRCRARLSRSDLGSEILQDIADGIRSLVSIGYMIDELEEERTAEDGSIERRRLGWSEFEAEMRAKHGADFDFTRAGDALAAVADVRPVFRVTRWTPFEVSCVAVPADSSVGVGRSAGAEIGSVSSPHPPADPAPPIETQETLMSEVQVQDNGAAERARIESITQVGKAYAKHGGESLALDYIAQGKSLADFQNQLMERIATDHTAAPATAPDIGLTKKEAQRYSIVRAIRAMVDKDWTAAGFERECHQAILKRSGLGEAPNAGFFVPYEVQKRDLSSGGGVSSGGALVATDNLAGNFIDLLRNRAVVGKLGATMLSGLQGNVTIPKQTGANTAYWLSNESTGITEGNLTLGQLALTPKNVGAYQEISRQLMLQSSPAVDSLVMGDLAKVLALAIDLASLEGSGAGGQPTGIANTAGIGSVTGTSLGWGGIVEFQTDVAGSNALAENFAYCTTPTVAGLLSQRQRFASTDTPLWEGNILEGKVAGFRALSTLQLTAASMIAGDFSQVVIGEWGMLEIALNPYANFTASITGIRAIQTVDVGIRYAGAFSRATTIT